MKWKGRRQSTNVFDIRTRDPNRGESEENRGRRYRLDDAISRDNSRSLGKHLREMSVQDSQSYKVRKLSRGR
jgi:hypothetical protein